MLFHILVINSPLFKLLAVNLAKKVESLHDILDVRAIVIYAIEESPMTLLQ
jgi:hypothetical protein